MFNFDKDIVNPLLTGYGGKRRGACFHPHEMHPVAPYNIEETPYARKTSFQI